MKGNLFSRRNRYVGFALMGLSLLASFQNCTKQNFGYDPANLYSASGNGLKIENGAVATNKKVLAVHFTGDTTNFAQMRISTARDMDSAQIPWTDFKTDTTYDLGSVWSGDGSADALLTIYAEARSSLQNAPVVPLAGQIGLDTIAPTVTPKEILKNGIQGLAYSKGQAVPVAWEALDPRSKNGYASDLDPQKGMKIGYTSEASCGDQVTWLGDWGPPTNDFKLPWPVASALDTFYVCVLAKDVAGNTTTLLSQPLTSQWRVLAGDNNQGNGGSANAGNVRFKYPSTLAMDSAQNLYVSDNQFASIRKITSVQSSGAVSRLIATYVGNEHSGTPVAGPALKSPYSPGQSLAFDAQDRLYFVSGGSIYRLSPNAQGDQVISNIVKICNDAPRIAIRKAAGKESLLIYSACTGNPINPATNAYLYSVPTEDLSDTKPLLSADLASKYILAGNGLVPASPYSIPLSQTLVVNGPGNPNSTGYPGAISVGPTGEVYLASLSNGSGYPWGQQSLRRLTFNADGSILQELLTTSISWIYQIAYVAPTSGSPFLVLVTSGGTRKVSLTAPTKGLGFYPSITPSFVSDGQVTLGVVVTPTTNGAAPELYVSVSTVGRVYHLDQDLNVLEVLGRPIYNAAEPVATQAMIGQPEGLTQDPLGQTFFFDSMNHIIRKVDTTGAIVSVAGQAGVPASKVFNGAPLSSASFDGRGRFNAATPYSLQGYFSADGTSSAKIYLAEGSTGRVQALDLAAQKVQTIEGLYTSSRVNPLFWFNGGMALVPGTDWLLVNHYCPYDTCFGSGKVFAGVLSAQNLNQAVDSQTTVLGDVTKDTSVFFASGSTYVPTGADPLTAPFRNSVGMRVDSKGNAFFSSYGFYQSQFVNGTLGPLTNIAVNGSSRFSPGYFEMLEDGDNRVFIYSPGEGLSYFTVPLHPTGPPAPIKSATLCLPGTFFKGLGGFAVTKAGNLLISDVANGRILEYFLRGDDGHLKLNSTCN